MRKLLSIIFLFIFCLTFVLPVNAKAVSDDFITINKESKHLGSRLHKEYVGYIFTVENNSNKNLLIDSISIQDNITGKVAYSTMKKSSLATGAKTIGTGLALALPTLTLSLIGSVLVAPFAMIANTCGNIGAKQDSKRYDKPFSGTEIKASSQIEIKTLAPKSVKPIITVIYHTQDNANMLKLTY